jgi:hypothetical protein
MTDPRLPAPHPGPPRPAAHLRAPTPRRRIPDSTGVRMVIGLAGLASASALATAMLPSVVPQSVIVTTGAGAAVDPAQQPQPSVIHVTRVIQLAPGQTLPPEVAANTTLTPAPKATAQPTPRVIIQTVTRQSGKP